MQWVSELPEMRSTSVVAVRGEGSFHGNWKTRPNSMYQSCQSDRKKRKERESAERKKKTKDEYLFMKVEEIEMPSSFQSNTAHEHTHRDRCTHTHSLSPLHSESSLQSHLHKLKSKRCQVLDRYLHILDRKHVKILIGTVGMIFSYHSVIVKHICMHLMRYKEVVLYGYAD